jgi:hypothetical protein
MKILIPLVSASGVFVYRKAMKKKRSGACFIQDALKILPQPEEVFMCGWWGW